MGILFKVQMLVLTLGSLVANGLFSTLLFVLVKL